ncbi:MAG: polynucleotide adenylyltransferase PcnB, partial [Proteobacteria bacterium]|nr:polynucleotide adenylyltransferase PcnB [Pseudomonadota bacterium]
MGAREGGQEAPAHVSLLLYDAWTERQATREPDLTTPSPSAAPAGPASGPVAPRGRPVIIPRAAHPISRAQISAHALKVLYRLKDAGYQAFLVGGSVRDLLLGVQPKDFDVATDALPEEIRRVFRNCRLIGRRFRLAHVHFGDEIIEVATFRAAAAPPEVDDEDHREVDDASGRILRDNVYGTIDEDVWRRDFTANSLYYNIADFSVWDYASGVEDVRARVLRLIGDPETRFREDPVRMLRAARFAAKLGFSVHPATRAPMTELAALLAGVPAARLFDETLKLFLSGHALASLERLREFDLLAHLLPAVAEELERDPDGAASRLLRCGLAGTDARVAADRAVTPTFLFAVLLYGPIQRLAAQKLAAGQPESQALLEATDAVTLAQVRRVAIPKRFTLPLRELLLLQPRFERRDGRRALSLLHHPRFRAAFDFLLLRAEAGLVPAELAAWWTEIQTVSAEERQQRVAQLAPAGPAEGGEGEPRQRRR